MNSRRARGMFVLAVLALASLCVQRNFTWNGMYSLFHDAVIGAPRMARDHGNLGAAYHQFGRYRTAKRHLTKSVSLDPRPKTTRLLGLTLHHLGQRPQAILVLERAFAMLPESVTCRTLGSIYADAKQWGKAKVWFQRAIEIRPYNPEALMALGMCDWHTHDLKAAQESFERAVEQNPALHEAWVQLGNVHLSEKRAEKAAQAFAAVLQSAPNHAGAHLNMGLALLQMNREPQAERAFQHALSLNRTLLPAHINLALLYERRQEWFRAAGHMKLAVQIAPGNAPLWSALGRVLERAGAQHQAALSYSTACHLNPRDWEVALKAGDLAMRRGHSRPAFEYYAHALKIDPDVPRASEAIDALRPQSVTAP